MELDPRRLSVARSAYFQAGLDDDDSRLLAALKAYNAERLDYPMLVLEMAQAISVANGTPSPVNADYIAAEAALAKVLVRALENGCEIDQLSVDLYVSEDYIRDVVERHA